MLCVVYVVYWKCQITQNCQKHDALKLFTMIKDKICQKNETDATVLKKTH